MDLSSVIEHLDVLPPDSGDLRNPATQQIGAPDKGVITRSVPVVMNRSGNGCHQQSDEAKAGRLTQPHYDGYLRQTGEGSLTY